MNKLKFLSVTVIILLFVGVFQTAEAAKPRKEKLAGVTADILQDSAARLSVIEGDLTIEHIRKILLMQGTSVEVLDFSNIADQYPDYELHLRVDEYIGRDSVVRKRQYLCQKMVDPDKDEETGEDYTTRIFTIAVSAIPQTDSTFQFIFDGGMQAGLYLTSRSKKYTIPTNPVARYLNIKNTVSLDSEIVR